MLNKNTSNKPKIIIMCFNYRKEKDIEAIKKEARTYFHYYKKISSEFDFKFISLESDVQENEELYDVDNDVYYWGYKFDKQIMREEPKVIHLFADSIEGYPLLEENYKDKQFITFCTITGIDGVRNFNEAYLEHLRHAIDVGNLYLFVLSNKVKMEFANKGLKAITSLPKVNMSRSCLKQTKHDKFTIGFASAPFKIDVWEDRGIFNLLTLAKEFPQFNFKIAWRYENYSDLLNSIEEYKLGNIEVINGYLNMYEFYSDVDVMIAPYSSEKNNHSSPLSIIESITIGIPVLVTEFVGIQDIIKDYGFGVVAKSELTDLILKLQDIYLNYDLYKKNTEKYGEKLFYVDSIENIYLDFYKEVKFQQASPTLNEWRNLLDNSSKYLVMGRDSMAKYYNDQFIAETYDESRFLEYPMRTYDSLERKAVCLCIEQFSPYKEQKVMLDVASGDGRFLRDLLNYGNVTAVENSPFMISVSSKKLLNSDKVVYIKDDFFDFNSDSKFDVISIFRFIRHFDYNDRKIIYRKLHYLLKNDGIILADFPNKQAETQLRSNLNWGSFNIYDVFWNRTEIIDELRDNGFRVLASIPIGEYLFPNKVMEYLPISQVVCFCKI